MKVKVGDRIYDGKNEPVMVILSEGEKKQIAEMPPGITRYCVYPDHGDLTANNHKKLKAWMIDNKESKE